MAGRALFRLSNQNTVVMLIGEALVMGGQVIHHVQRSKLSLPRHQLILVWLLFSTCLFCFEQNFAKRYFFDLQLLSEEIRNLLGMSLNIMLIVAVTFEFSPTF